MEEPSGLLPTVSHRVRHNWSNLACMHALEKEMATHSSILDWRIPGTEEPGGLSSMGSHRVGHDWSDLAAAVCLLNLVSGEIQKGRKNRQRAQMEKKAPWKKRKEKTWKGQKETEINEGFEEKTRKERDYTKRRHNISSGKRLLSELTKLTINKILKPDEIKQ